MTDPTPEQRTRIRQLAEDWEAAGAPAFELESPINRKSTSMSQFETPASATGIDWNDLNGALLVIQVTEIARDINTTFGTTDAVRATITVIDGPNQGDVHADTLVFPRVLQSQLSSRIGKTVLGRLGQGVAKPGQSPPWMLQEATPADQKTAGAFMAAQAANQLTADDI